MKRIPAHCLLLISVLMLPGGGTASAQNHGFGLGIILGEPSGVSMKEWLSSSSAVDGAVAWSFRREAAINLHADYLVHRYGILKVEEGSLPIYFGIGGRLKLGDDVSLGVRVPVGVDYLFAHDPLDVFVEIVPMLILTPATEGELSGALGVRYYFGQR